MGAKEQMIAILRDRDTQRINFRYSQPTATAAIDHTVFSRVAAGLESGHFKVVEGKYNVNKLSYSSWAEDDLAANTFYLGRNNRHSRDFNALVVHEAVHAYFDLTSTSIPWLDNEAVAYIAHGFYLRNSGYPMARLEEDEPYELGYRVARDIAAGQSGSAWITLLRDKLNTDSRYAGYIHGSFSGNG